MIEAYIELLIASCIAFRMFEIREIWNNWDKFSVTVHFIGIVCVISFFLFVCWFVLIKVKPLNLKKLMERKASHKDKIDEARQAMKNL